MLSQNSVKAKTPPRPQAWFFFAFAAMICYSGRAGGGMVGAGGYGDMGEGEILRLWANVWLSPAVLPEEGPGAGFAEFCKGRGHPHPHARGGDFYTDLDKCPKPYKIAAPTRARRR